MKIEKNESEGASESAQPKKLLLGKRVLRHFNVRTSIQTGAGTTVTATQPPTASSGALRDEATPQRRTLRRRRQAGDPQQA